jgi:hypothetical protein
MNNVEYSIGVDTAKPRMDWTDEMTLCIIELCIAENQAGTATENGFKSQGWVHIRGEFLKRFPDSSADVTQIQSKYKALKSSYKAFKRLSAAPGFTTDAAGRLTASSAVWNDFLADPKNYEERSRFRYKPLKFVAELKDLFPDKIIQSECQASGGEVASLTPLDGPARTEAADSNLNGNTGDNSSGRKRKISLLEGCLKVLSDSLDPFSLFHKAHNKFRCMHDSRVSAHDSYLLMKSFANEESWCKLYLCLEGDESITFLFADMLDRASFSLLPSLGAISSYEKLQTPMVSGSKRRCFVRDTVSDPQNDDNTDSSDADFELD